MPLREWHLYQPPHATSSDLACLHMSSVTFQNSQSATGSQSAKLNKSAAQRRYRKKEGQGFLQLRQALKKVSKDDPRSKQDTLKRASRELRRLADENNLLLEQKAFIEAWNYKQDPRPIPDEDPLLGMEQWWPHDTTKMGDITRSDVARHRVLSAPNMNIFEAPDAEASEGLFQMKSPTVTYGQSNHLPWAPYQSGDITQRPYNGTGYSTGDYTV